MLDEMLAAWGTGVERAVLLDVDEELLIWRLGNRLTCSNKSCGRTYNLQSKPPQVADTCDVCKSPLYQRSDDLDRDAISERVSTYRRESKPVCEHYAGNLLFVKPTKETTEQDVFSMVTRALRARRDMS
jgi:adenylate kinase